MKIKPHFAIAGLLMAGFLATGCQQQQSTQQVAETPEPVAPAPAPAPAPVVRPAPAPAPVVPQVKAKGNYKGPVDIDRNTMQQYQR